MELKNSTKGLFKDVWIYKLEDDSNYDMYNLNAFNMCAVDDSLHTSAGRIRYDENVGEIKNLGQNYGKIKTQKYTLDFPCLVYNVSLNEIKIQSTIEPDICTTLHLEGRDFLTFVNFDSFADIGLKDKRNKEEKS